MASVSVNVRDEDSISPYNNKPSLEKASFWLKAQLNEAVGLAKPEDCDY